MEFAAISGAQMILGGLLMLTMAFVLRRTFSQSHASRQRDPTREVRNEIRQAESSYAALIRQMEVKFHDYSREVEGRIETQIALLNRLLIEADQKIARLEALQRPLSTDASLDADTVNQPRDLSTVESRDEQAVIYQLADQGLSIDEIAAKTAEPASHVKLILKMRPPKPGPHAA